MQFSKYLAKKYGTPSPGAGSAYSANSSVSFGSGGSRATPGSVASDGSNYGSTPVPRKNAYQVDTADYSPNTAVEMQRAQIEKMSRHIADLKAAELDLAATEMENERRKMSEIMKRHTDQIEVLKAESVELEAAVAAVVAECEQKDRALLIQAQELSRARAELTTVGRMRAEGQTQIEPEREPEPEPEPEPAAAQSIFGTHTATVEADVCCFLAHRSVRMTRHTSAICSALRTAEYPEADWVSVLMQMPAATLSELVDALVREKSERIVRGS